MDSQMSGPLPPYQNRGTQVLAVQWTSVSLAFLIVSLRVFVRLIIRKTGGWDDYTILVALAFALSQAIISIWKVKSGFGRHIEYLSPAQISSSMFYTTLSEGLHTIGTFLVRVSVCISVLRLIPISQGRALHWWTYGLLTFFAVISTATFLIIMLQCIPIQGAWDRSIKADCIPYSDLTIIATTQGAFSVIMDFLCALFPILFLRNLQAKPRAKIALFVILGLGFFTAGTAIARAVLIKFGNQDITWVQSPVAIWACLEQNIGIIVASMPALHQLFTVFNKHNSLGNCPRGTQFARPPPRKKSWMSASRDDTIGLTDLDTGSVATTVVMKDVEGGTMANTRKSSTTSKLTPRSEYGFDSQMRSLSVTQPGARFGEPAELHFDMVLRE